MHLYRNRPVTGCSLAMLETLSDWFLSLGSRYGVDPIVFGSIYVGAIPFFTVSVGRLVRNLKLRRPITLPALSARFFFVSAYLYLLTVGRNIPEWVYAMLATMIAYGAVSTIRRIQRHVAGA